ncbi:FAD-dependent oxidoreductase [Paucibacter sp. O1-1]|nr:FAD-dependent oxidoreductase [Paucibacter sp. O1-1]MDA3824458.1 FAD-dependent oxidoreductase [Paucibacter sp. O1-1]
MSRKENLTFGTSYYSEAIYTPGGTLMQPAALMRGLAKNLPENVRLAEHTPVSEINKEASGCILITPNGRVRCPKVILANNIFAQEFGFLKDRIFTYYDVR